MQFSYSKAPALEFILSFQTVCYWYVYSVDYFNIKFLHLLKLSRSDCIMVRHKYQNCDLSRSDYIILIFSCTFSTKIQSLRDKDSKSNSLVTKIQSLRDKD
jgi:hypothetical protein